MAGECGEKSKSKKEGVKLRSKNRKYRGLEARNAWPEWLIVHSSQRKRLKIRRIASWMWWHKTPSQQLDICIQVVFSAYEVDKLPVKQRALFCLKIKPNQTLEYTQEGEVQTALGS